MVQDKEISLPSIISPVYAFGNDTLASEEAPIQSKDISLPLVPWMLRLRQIIRSKHPQESFYIGDCEEEDEEDDGSGN